MTFISGNGPRVAANDERLQPRQNKVTEAAAKARADCDRALSLFRAGGR